MKKCYLYSWLFIAVTASSSLHAQTFQSNVEGLVIKGSECHEGKQWPYLHLTLINRNKADSSGVLNVKITDKDGDIVYQENQFYVVGFQNGSNKGFTLNVGNCIPPYQYHFTITECKTKLGSLNECVDPAYKSSYQ